MEARFYLEADLCTSAREGRHNFIGKMANVLSDAGMRVGFHDTKDRGRDGFDGYFLTHMKPPAKEKGLTFRRVYHYPFWQIEQCAERWDWDVTRATFDADIIDPNKAKTFYGFWQKRLYQGLPAQAVQGGFAYVALQGHLLKQRSFQRCTPLHMVELCLRHDASRQIVVGLHPKENYCAAEHAALAELKGRFARLSVQTGGMEAALGACDYVVSMNSAAAFAAYFFAKPVMLFAGIDFHHIAVNANPETAADAFGQIMHHQPDVAAYLWWFWQQQSINAGRSEAETKIAARLARFGWPVTT